MEFEFFFRMCKKQSVVFFLFFFSMLRKFFLFANEKFKFFSFFFS